MYKKNNIMTNFDYKFTLPPLPVGISFQCPFCKADVEVYHNGIESDELEFWRKANKKIECPQCSKIWVNPKFAILYQYQIINGYYV